LPRPLRDLDETLRRLPPAGSDDRALVMDELVARVIRGVALFCDEPGAIVPAQRALRVLSARPKKIRPDIEHLQSALRRIDEQLGRAEGGFSRLLDTALSSGDVLAVSALSPDAVSDELRPLADRLALAARVLAAVDDLADALDAPRDLPAAAAILDATLGLLEEHDGASRGAADDAGRAWLQTRELDAPLEDLVGARPSLLALDGVDALDERTARALALWTLAHRLAAKRDIHGAADRSALDTLLARGRLVPIEVFDAADLWGQLDDDGKR
jgi:hypothetical protein